MSSSLRGWCRGVGLLVVLVAAAPLGAHALEVSGSCTVEFFSTTTVHDFEGKAPCALLAIDAPDASGHYGARAEVEIARIGTGIAARDKKMREVLEAKKFPRIVATFSAVDPAAVRAARKDALPFRVQIHGVERTITPVLDGFSEVPGKRAHFRATFTLSLKDLGVTTPTVMGFIRVDDTVRVAVEVDLAAKNGAAPAAGAPKH